VTPRQFLAEVRRRTWLLAIASGGTIDHDEAERQATRSVIAEARKQPHSTHLGTSNPSRDGVTPQTARAFLTNYLSALHAKLRAPITPKTTPASVVSKVRVRPRAYTHRQPTTPAVPPVLPTASEPLPAPQMLIFTGTSTAAQLITDDEFHTSLHSVTTQTWRASIEHNTRVAEERARKRSTWVG
jgi:hypothetical protein